MPQVVGAPPKAREAAAARHADAFMADLRARCRFELVGGQPASALQMDRTNRAAVAALVQAQRE